MDLYKQYDLHVRNKYHDEDGTQLRLNFLHFDGRIKRGLRPNTLGLLTYIPEPQTYAEIEAREGFGCGPVIAK